ncbi:hypothetical protein HPP92_027225 [Vanilla planifolia]|uniref:Uncharacterized protein n=1 Tax=Vanilla planifolia TaxID=51239 RepID=A0A835PE13_VANPL|nr:hypothetical protein HPP92_027225 [Vanilla planifolia]
MEVMVRRSPDFQFDTVVNSPYATAPSSPRFFGDPFDERFHYTSVPTSPTRAAAIFSHLSDETGGGDLLDFAFDYGKQSGSVELPEISTADELFEKGRIRLLQPPPPAGSSHPGGERGGRGPPLSPDLAPRAERGTRPRGGQREDQARIFCRSTLCSPQTRRKEGRFRNGSFRSTESGGGSLRRAGLSAASAHEIHYTANRALAEVQRKKTPLAYQRQGLFSCLQFNPAIRSITKGFINDNSFPRGRP